MDLPVFYCPELTDSAVLTLSEDTSRHIVQVLRMKPGAHLQLTDGAGQLATAAIVDDHKKHCTVRVEKTVVHPAPQRKISIAISLLKNATRLEWFVEKATELGVCEIIPLLCERTEKQHFKYERIKQILVSAMMQSQQVWLPRLHEPTVYSAALSADYSTRLIAHCMPGEKQPISQFMHLTTAQILIGPEGDFSPKEVEAAQQTGYFPVSLGNSRLRTETAGVVAATVLCL